MIAINEGQKDKLIKLWMIYGNEGKKHTHCNHRYIQNIIEHGEDSEDFYKASRLCDLTEECIKEVKKIINEDCK